MVIVQLKGGLGNQLFQIAAARELGQRLRTEVLADLSWFDPRSPAAPGVTRRDYLLSPVQLAPRAASAAHVRSILHPPPRLLRWLRRTTPRHVLRNPTNAPLADFFTLRGDIYLDGYWQGEAFFPSTRATLQTHLARLPVSAEDESWVAQLQTPGSVALHVRRGDFVTDPAARQLHRTLPLDYYAAGLAALGAQEPVRRLVVFSDDLPWCRAHLGTLGVPCQFVARTDPRATPVDDLLCLAQARALVISNSTFSWWAAWIASARGARVVAPARWFIPAGYDAWNDRLIVPGWTRL